MGEKEGTICIFKTHPRPKEDAPPILFTHKDLSEAPAVSVVLLPHHYIIIGGELLLVVGGDFWFCILYTLKIR